MARRTMLLVLAIMSVLVTACGNREQLKNDSAHLDTAVEVSSDGIATKVEVSSDETATKVEVSPDDTAINIITFSKEEIELKRATMVDTNVARGNLRYGIKPAEYDVPAGQNGTSFTYFADGSNAHFAADHYPHIDIDEDDAVEIAKAYVELYDSWQWSGKPTTYNGHEVYFSWGEIEVDGVPTGVKNNERILYDKAKNAYLNGQWDGTLAMLDSHYIELSRTGYLVIDGYLGEGQDNLDLPNDFDFTNANTGYVCIPPYGTFIIENKKLVNYLRLERTEITSNPLEWKGYDFDTEEFNELTETIEDYCFYFSKFPLLEYDEDKDKLYLKTFDSDENCYTYVFSDYKKKGKLRLLKVDNNPFQ